jgi:histone deacetylase 6
MERIKVREAVREEANLVHAAELWEKINSFEVQPPEFYTLNKTFFTRISLYVNEKTALCARLSLGGVIETCRAVAEGRVANAFAIVR